MRHSVSLLTEIGILESHHIAQNNSSGRGKKKETVLVVTTQTDCVLVVETGLLVSATFQQAIKGTFHLQNDTE